MPFLLFDIALLAILTIYAFALLENGSVRYGWWFFVIVAGYLGYLYYYEAFNSSYIRYITWQNVLWFVPFYFSFGACWAVLKWQMHLLHARRWFTENEKELRTANWSTTMGTSKPRSHKSLRSDLFGSRELDWQQGQNISQTKLSEIAPLASEFKRKIMDWIVFWPWSAIWTIINDPITRLVKAIYNWLASLLQRMSNRTFRDA